MNRGSRTHLVGREFLNTPATRRQGISPRTASWLRAASLAILLLWVVGVGAGRTAFAAQQQGTQPAAKPPAAKSQPSGKQPGAKQQPMTQEEQLQESGNEDAGDEEMLTGQQNQRQLGAPEGRANGAAPASPPKEIEYKTHLDHTAIWVGDQFHYLVTVEYPPKMEFVLDGLTKETVNMDPFQMIDVQKNVTNLKDGRKRLVVDITLSSFATGQPSQQLPQLTLFYFKKEAGVTTAQEAAAESLPIPGPVIGLRSTLPPNPDEIRDPTGVNNWATSRRTFGTVGWLSLFALVVGVGYEGVQVVQRSKGQKGPDRRKAMEAVRDRWASSVPGDFSDNKRVMEFYDRSYQDVKEYLGYYMETPALGLTADELSAEMKRLNASPDLAQKVNGVMGTLESARYAADGTAALRDNAPKTAQSIREIFSYSPR